MSLQTEREPIVVTHEGGVAFAAQVRAHRVSVDQPRRGGGEDAAPSPIELLGVSLGTCVALYVQQFCQTRSLPFAGMRVEVRTTGASNPNRIERFEVDVVLPAEIPAHYAEMIQRVARSCPAHNTLTRGAEVSVNTRTVAPVIAASRRPALHDASLETLSARTPL